jgi:hypothetical protein
MLALFGAGGAILVSLLLAGCGELSPPGSTTSHGGPVRDHVSFVDHLRARGVTVDIAGVAQQPFLRGSGTKLRLSGDSLSGPAEVEAYNYVDQTLGANGVQVAKEDAERIQPDGTPKATSVLWTGPPHFYRVERVTVLYVGSDPAVLKLLAELLGAQFAGR